MTRVFQASRNGWYARAVRAAFGQAKQRLPVRNPAPQATPERLNQVLVVDFMHDALVCGRRFRTLNVVADFKREVLAIEIDLNIPAQCVVRVLDRIVATHGYSLKMCMDNGPERVSLPLAQWADAHGDDTGIDKTG